MKKGILMYILAGLGIWAIYMMAHILDLIAFFGLWSVVYECIVSSFLFIIHYSIALIRFCYTYLIIFLIICIFAKSLFTGYGYNYKLKFFGINLNKYTNIPQLNYFIFFLQEYNYFILLVLNLIFFIFIFYYGLYYNIFIIGIFLLFYVFLGLNIFLKYLIKKYEPTLYANKNMLHFYLNIVLCIVMILYVSLISETIFKEINFKIDFTEYLLGTLLRKDRFFLKLKDDYNFTRLWALYKNEKFSINYLYFKNNILNSNILNQASYPKLKYSNLNGNGISDFYTLINKQNIDNIQIEKINLETLNLNNNNIYFENEVVWYERNFQNKNLEQFDELTKMKIFKYKNNLNWYTYLLNVYNLNWSNFIPSAKEIQNVTTLLKSEKYKNYEYIYDILLFKDDVKFLNENMLDNYNEYTLLKKKNITIYKFDFHTLLKYKYVYNNKNIFNFINELFLITNTNKNNINLQTYSILNFKYQDISNLINELLNFKNNLLELLNDKNNFNIILYKYNYFLNWWEKNCYIIHNMYSDSGYKQKYVSLKKYLVTEKNLLALNVIEPGKSKSDIKEIVEELNSDQWIGGLLSPLDLLKKSTIIKFIDRNILYFNIYKNLLSFNLKEDSVYYYDYLFREFGLFKINHIMYSIVTFEGPDSWFDYRFKEYLPFLKNIGVYEKTNSFWKFHRPTNKYFYYFLDYNNNLSVVSNNVLYNVSETTYFRNMDITTRFESKLLDFNKGKWSLYFDLIEFRYKKFMEACYYIYACDLNYTSYTFYNDDANSFKEKFFNESTESTSTIKKNINAVNINSNGTNWVQLLKFWLNLYGIEKVDSIKNYILVVADNAYLENPKFKKYLLANAEYIAINWAGKFSKGASLIEFINMLKNLNLFLLNEKNPYVEYLKTHKFQDLKNKFLNRSDYWGIYSYYSQFSSIEERIVYETAKSLSNFKAVAELAYNTSWCMTLDPVEYDTNFEFLIYKTFFEECYDDLMDANYYFTITDNKDAFLKDFLPEMLLDQRVFRLALFDFYFDDEANPFDIFKKPEPTDPRMNFHPLPLIHTSAYANALGYGMMDTLNHIEDLFNAFYIPTETLLEHLFNGVSLEELDELLGLDNLVESGNLTLAQVAKDRGILEEAEFQYLKQSLTEANNGMYDTWYIKQQIIDRVEYYNMLFKLDALRYLEMRYKNDLEFYEDILDEMEIGYNKILVDTELELETRFKSLFEWKKNKELYKAEMLKKELNEIIDYDLFLSLERYVLNKNWKKYNYQRYREEFPAPFKNRLHFFKNKK